ncbi:hypothetical protein BAUCODRAFT_119614 [Baudoinia panamericana UAMH 10762]|uniref:Uncharacterized protein n=1 Tax=Baudoinia panamericana (strain UAMH 10762) TaxID=717646 RepID=M2NKT3_BAUPA|nr:uncharacterized protein BAUCODRAFT_119614 [Baudoinia panamericana UAMH 10762]EMD00055.1 hypothetical protein BAUCODRAFT_119614 [Baudoinia panamericana UAMH 10762]
MAYTALTAAPSELLVLSRVLSTSIDKRHPTIASMVNATGEWLSESSRVGLGPQSGLTSDERCMRQNTNWTSRAGPQCSLLDYLSAHAQELYLPHSSTDPSFVSRIRIHL